MTAVSAADNDFEVKSRRIPCALWLLRWCAVALLALPLYSCAEQDSGAHISIIDVTVIDASLGVRPNQTVIFEKDRIVAVGPSNETAARGQIINGSGAFLIPGLWDMHIHLTYDERFTAVMPSAFIRYGITSVRDTGGLLEKLQPVVERIRNDSAPAPRIFYSGPLLDGESPVYDGGSVPRLGVANESPEAAAANVQRIADAGGSFIKIYEMVEPDVFMALVDAAKQHALPIAAHVPLSMSVSDVGPNVQSMEHLRNIDLDCAANASELLSERTAMLAKVADRPAIDVRRSIHQAQRDRALQAFDADRCEEVIAALKGTIQVPTASLNLLFTAPPSERADWQQALEDMPVEIRDEWRDTPTWIDRDPAKRDQSLTRYTLDMVARLHSAGVPIGAGTDTPIGRAIPGYSLHHELEVLVDAGLSPMDALRAATIRPAEFFGLEGELGTIGEGMRADLVLLDANPLEDIRNTRSIRTVFSEGKVAYTVAE